MQKLNNDITNDYIPEINGFIGSGSFGIVVKAFDRKLNRDVALKRSLKVNRNISKEIKIYRIINDSRFVPELIDIYFTVDDSKTKIIQNLVFEYMNGKNDIYYFQRIYKRL